MIYYILSLFSIFLAFFVTYFIIPKWIPRAIKAGIYGKSMNKYDHPIVAEMGGITVIFGFLVGVFFYVLANVIFKFVALKLLLIYGMVLTLILIAIIGMVDDILGWKIGLKQWQKPILVFLSSLPFTILLINIKSIKLFFFNLNLGILFPLLIFPLGITGAANLYNIIAGFDGLESGIGIIMLAFYLIYLTQLKLYWLVIITAILLASLIAFHLYYKYPAKILPGDTLTYFVGGFIAIIAIISNTISKALILFIPHFIDFFIHYKKGRLKKEAFGKPNPDNSLELRYAEKYKLSHYIIYYLKLYKGKAYEWEVTLVFLIIEFILGIIALMV